MKTEPYFAVIFTSQRNHHDEAAYEKTALRMAELAALQPGYLGLESTRGADGFGITVSYWKTERDIINWKKNSEHLLAQELGRTQWYETFSTRICRVEREYSFSNQKN